MGILTVSTKTILQVALDFVDESRALKAADEAYAGGADWLEAGTPLIKAEGLNIVRMLKQRFPKATIVADLKTLDAGRIEVECAAKAGAGVVNILAFAPDSTILEAIDAGRKYGALVSVDLIGHPDPVTRAQEAQELGADLVNVHCPIDLQMRGLDPFETLRAVASAVSIPVSVAGGIHSESAADAVAAGAGIVIIGGAITKSADARAATAQIRRALDEGVRVETRLYKRVTDSNIREALEQVSTANLSDALHRSGDLPGILPILPGLRCVGPALTVRTAPGDWAKPVEAIDLAAPGDVIVIEAGGVTPVVWGELATHSAAGRKLAGVVIDGAIRDTVEIRRLKFPAFAKLISPTAGEPKGHGEIGVTVKLSGVKVNPGDWMLGDDDGVVVLPREKAAEYANRAMNVLETENRIRGEITAGSTLSSVTELLRWEKVG